MKKSLLIGGSVLLLALLCRYSTECAEAVRSALNLCLTSAIPALFPFFAVSSLSISCGLAQALGHFLSPLMRRLFHLPGCGAAALALGFLGGYPAGARMSAELWHAGLCNRSEAEALVSCCNNTGPAFLIGMCGVGLFGSLRAGLFLYAVHMVSALLAALLLRPQTVPSDCEQSEFPLPPFSVCLTQSVCAAGRSCLSVSAFILFFSVIICLLRLTGILSVVSHVLFRVLAPFGLTADGTQSLGIGCMELTQGLAGLTAQAGSAAARLTVVSFLCAFGGFSVLFQTAAATDGLSFSCCLRGKLLHAALATVLCALLLRCHRLLF